MSMITIVIVLGVSVLASNISSVRGIGGGPIGDDYNYSSVDPDCAKWNCAPAEMIQECDPGTTVCHDMRVDNPPGFLFSENYACHYGWDPSSTHSGCGRDARMHSAQAFTYTAGTGQRMVLTERYSPNRRDASLCPIFVPGNPALNTAWPPDDYSMHWMGLRYAAQTSSFAYVIIEHACIWDGFTPNWKYGLRAYYTDSGGAEHYSFWTDYVFDDNQWLDLTMEVGNNGQDTRLTVKNASTGLAYFMNIGTNLGATNGSVEIAVQYRHNEASRTDYVDARISDPDFGISSSPTLNICPGTLNGAPISLMSLGGFAGTVSLSSSLDHTNNYVSQYLGSTSLTLSAGGSAATALYFSAQYNSNAEGTYVAVVTGTSGSIIHNTAVTVNVSFNYCTGGGGGSGSVASGSLITLADGRRIPVQNVHAGMRVVVYNVPTAYETIATVSQIQTVIVNNTLTINTTAGGSPFRADANPYMKLWVLTPNGPVERPITTISTGDQIYNYDVRSWVRVTDVTITYGGLHTMYDILTDPNFTNSGLILEVIANGYPDCPARGCKESPSG